MSQKSDDAKSSSVREFIYLDVPKIYSYLSQLEDGLRLLIEKVEDEYTHTEIDPEVKETIVKATVNASVNAKVPMFGGADADFGLERTRRTMASGESVNTYSGGGRNDLSVLHHKAFDLVYEKLKGNML